MKNTFAIVVLLLSSMSVFAQQQAPRVIDYRRVCNFSLGPRINFKDTKTMNELLQHLRERNYRLVEHDSDAQLRLEALSFVCHAGKTVMQPRCSELSAEVIMTNLVGPHAPTDRNILRLSQTIRYSGLDSRFIKPATKSAALNDLVLKIPDCSSNGFIGRE